MTKYLISCCAADTPEVDKIDEALRAAGLDVRYWKREIGYGNDFMAWMYEQAEECETCLAMWSPNYRAERNKFSALERNVYLTDDPDGKKRALIPIVLEPCDMGKLFNTKVAFPYHQLGLEQLVQTLTTGGQQILDAPDPPHKLTFKNVSLTPDRPVEGRADDLERLRDTLTTKGKAAIIKATGGMGKSTLARHYIEKYHRDYTGILWLHSETQSEMSEDFTTLALHLGETIPAGTPLPTIATHLFNKLTGQWLIVYDNVKDEKALNGLLAEAPDLHVIITSRWTDWPDKYGPLDVEVLAPDAATDLLMSESQRTDDREGAATLAEALGHLPLALVAAGGLLKFSNTPFSDYAKELESVIHKCPSGEYPDSVMGAVKLSYDACSLDAQALLDLFTWCATDLIEPWLVENLASIQHKWKDAPIPEILEELAKNKARLAKSMTELQQRSLLSRNDGTLSLHRMSAAAIRALQGEERENHHITAAAVIAARCPADAVSERNWDQCRRLTPHALALADHNPLPKNNALRWLFNQSSIFLRAQGRWGEATALAKKNLDISLAIFGPDHMETGTAHTQLGNCLRAAGEHEEAEKAFAEALRIVRALPEEREKLATRLSNHATALMDLKKFDKAEAEYNEAHEIDIDLHGANSSQVGIRYNNLATLEAKQGNLPDAIDYAKKALEIEEAQEIPDKQNLGFRTYNLGAFLFENGDLKGAEKLLNRAYDICRDIYDDPQHPNTVASASWLIGCLLARAENGEDPEKRVARGKEILNAHPSLKAEYGL